MHFRQKIPRKPAFVLKSGTRAKASKYALLAFSAGTERVLRYCSYAAARAAQAAVRRAARIVETREISESIANTRLLAGS